MALRPLLLVGGGGLAREVLAAVRLLPNEWKPIGALDDDPSRHGADLDGIPVLGGLELIGELKDAAVVACVANARRPEGRLTVVRRLDLPDDRWATIVHPSAFVPEGSVLGPGTVLLAGAVVTTPLRIGAHVVAMPHVLITHRRRGHLCWCGFARRLRQRRPEVRGPSQEDPRGEECVIKKLAS